MKHDSQTDSAFELSMSEIAALSARALRGAGRSWGEAEEGAEAACWLARAGLDWASALLEVLALSTKDKGCPLRAGIALADCAGLPDGLSSATAQRHKLHCPCFVLPFAARVANQTGRGIMLEWAGGRVMLPPNCAPALEGLASAAATAEVTITPVAPERAPCPDWPQTHRGAVSAAQYARLMDFMMAFTVPSSASSLVGAGARGDDND